MFTHTSIRNFALAAFALSAGVVFSAPSEASSNSVRSCVGSSVNKVVKCCEQQTLVSPYWRNMARAGRCSPASVVCVTSTTGTTHVSVVKRCYVRYVQKQQPNGGQPENGRNRQTSRQTSSNGPAAGANGPN